MGKYWLTIIIPCYNAEKYIKRCLDSIFVDNDATGVQVICVNDGSTDKTAESLNDYNNALNDRILILSQPNSGVGASRNAALDKALGQWLAFVDADDYLKCDALLKLRKISSTYQTSETDIIYFGFSRISRNGSCNEIIYDDTKYGPDGKKEILLKYDEISYGVCWSKLYRREAVSNIRFNINLKLYEDVDFNLAMLMTCRDIVLCSSCMYVYSCNDSSATIQFFDNDKHKKFINHKIAKFKETVNNICVNIEERLIILDRLYAGVAHSILYSIYSIYRSKNKPSKSYEIYNDKWHFLLNISKLCKTGGVFTAPIPKTFYRLSSIHPFLGHLFLKTIFTTEKVLKTLKK